MKIDDRVRDTVSGYRGTIIATTEWKGGRRTHLVQAPTHGAAFVSPVWIEEAMLEVDPAPEAIVFYGDFASAARGYGTGD